MVALFAFITGFYYHLSFGYFVVGFIVLLLDDDCKIINIENVNMVDK